MKNILSIDIGGSKILAGVVTEEGKIITETKIHLNKPTEDSVLCNITEICDKMANNYNISGISASIPGLVDTENGIWLEAVFSKVKNFSLGEILYQRYNLPVFLENDANNSAYGEKYFGHARDANDFIWLTVSNGCGAGIFLEGKLFTGASGHAGELGHICVTNKNLKCPCGNTGCLEAAAAGPGISIRYRELTGKSFSAKEIAEKAKEGDADAVYVYKKTGVYIGRAIASAVNVINVPLVIIGGGISMDYDLIKDDINRTVEEKIYRTANNNLAIMQTKLGYYASLIGAAANALGKLK
jgi:glucokinase